MKVKQGSTCLCIRLFLVLFSLQLLCTNVSAADLKEGFMDYRWGEGIFRYPALEMLYAKGDMTYYRNPGEAYTIGNIVADDVIFGFYQENLYAVFIRINNLEMYDEIERYLKSKYGFPGTKLSDKEQLTTQKWKYEGVKLKLKVSQIDDRMKLGMYYQGLLKSDRQQKLMELNEPTYQFFPIDKNKKPEMIPLLKF